MGLVYTIDVVESKKRECFAFRLSTDKAGVLSIKEAKALGDPKDKKALRFLFEEKKEDCVYLDSEDLIEGLQAVSATGRLFHKGSRLICDLLGRTGVIYRVGDLEGDEIEVTGHLTWGKLEVSIDDCDLFLPLSPACFVKGVILKIVDPKIHARWTNKLGVSGNFLLQGKEKEKFLDNFSDGEVPFAPKVIFEEGVQKEQVEEEVLPFLLLKDKHGSYANLWMRYGSGREVAMHELGIDAGEREKSWEQDLFETDFIKKQVDASHYYCPLDKVAKSLTFLLELGWEIQDAERRRILCPRAADLSMDWTESGVRARARIDYESHTASLKDVVGSFNRRESFIELGNGSVGLIPEGWEKKEIPSLIDGEVLGEELVFPKSKVWSLSHLFEGKTHIRMDAGLEKLREQVLDQNLLEEVLPGPEFLGVLRPYQQEGLNWLHFLRDYGFGGILADDMGLGKTVQVLSLLSRSERKAPSLIVMPTSLLFHWRQEIQTFLPDRSVVLHRGTLRSKDLEFLQSNDVILVSYGTLLRDVDLLKNLDLEYLILDEAQAIKNPDAKISQSVCLMKSQHRLSITGTPIENHLLELWSQFRFLQPDLFPSKKEFQAQIVASQADSRYLAQVRKTVKPFILRRRKGEVAKDLPEKIEQTVYCEMGEEQRSIYESFVASLKGGLLQKVTQEGVAKHRMEVFEAILRLRQIACHPLLVDAMIEQESSRMSVKLDLLMKDLETLVEEGHKVLVYSQFTSMLNLIAKQVQERAWTYVRLDGSTRDREGVVRKFQEDPKVSLFLLSLKAGGVGLNLTAADYVLLFEPWWNEAAENQAIDRAHRIGRVNSVIAKRYIVAESIEEKIMALKASKKALVDSVLSEGGELQGITIEDFAFLLGSS